VKSIRRVSLLRIYMEALFRDKFLSNFEYIYTNYVHVPERLRGLV
jgi:hypothetical protein